jgi:hypothetical protein
MLEVLGIRFLLESLGFGVLDEGVVSGIARLGEVRVTGLL